MAERERIRIFQVEVNGRMHRFEVGENYQARAAFQREACEDGTHWHNPVEDECCPCFQCCSPKTGVT